MDGCINYLSEVNQAKKEISYEITNMYNNFHFSLLRVVLLFSVSKTDGRMCHHKPQLTNSNENDS